MIVTLKRPVEKAVMKTVVKTTQKTTQKTIQIKVGTGKPWTKYKIENVQCEMSNVIIRDSDYFSESKDYWKNSRCP